MQCYQCEQARGGKKCTGDQGVCGKTKEASDLMDTLTGSIIALAADKSAMSPALSRKIIEGLFMTLTNVNFDPSSLKAKISSIEEELAQGNEPYDMGDFWDSPEDIRSLKSLILFGVKGIAAYAYHSLLLGYTDEEVNSFIFKALKEFKNCNDQAQLLKLALEAGEANYKAMGLLDRANTEVFGIPSPVKVKMEVEAGPFIVISGHDLLDLKLLLEQTEGKGVNVYTHGEMLPAHSYPGLNKYPHLKGNFGTSWQNQQKEFDNVPAAFLFTTNCLMPPKGSYIDRVFTTSQVGFPGTLHIGEDRDFSPLIQKAIDLGGYSENKPMQGINGGTSVMTGFGHQSVLSKAGDIVNAVKSGDIKHFLFVGGCDGAKPGRSYYTDLVKSAPEGTIILTLACGKYRFNDLDIGEIGGIPRILDMGQCNDSYSAIKVALALAEAFNCGPNELPLSFAVSWYEQKAVSILLTLLYLGIKGIRLGPSLPAFLSPGILSYLVENYGIAPITTPDEDLAAFLG